MPPDPREASASASHACLNYSSSYLFFRKRFLIRRHRL
eukprot:CAMPEP_0181223880 /NCGR_PEP_ID=MMETSP1096-20121128/30799_1 /TAXON_ID=156174 ORGANISM="Chrysochromulina ericina, Strain CCMP281" /NCGR_SAMPLE_ID=MMETSP1096 /ASSEMBLY_ACC=CAM_ASM_000453 /LENGTH=37 /DNA_ID= /DNA_START= /DNA_END= /DNA_ORIENTATION=